MCIVKCVIIAMDVQFNGHDTEEIEHLADLDTGYINSRGRDPDSSTDEYLLDEAAYHVSIIPGESSDTEEGWQGDWLPDMYSSPSASETYVMHSPDLCGCGIQHGISLPDRQFGLDGATTRVILNQPSQPPAIDWSVDSDSESESTIIGSKIANRMVLDYDCEVTGARVDMGATRQFLAFGITLTYMANGFMITRYWSASKVVAILNSPTCNPRNVKTLRNVNGCYDDEIICPADLIGVRFNCRLCCRYFGIVVNRCRFKRMGEVAFRCEMSNGVIENIPLSDVRRMIESAKTYNKVEE